LVAQGFTQVEGLNFEETYALVARLEAIWMLLAFTTHHDFKLYQMDVKSAFLNGPIQELVYVEQPPGFEDSKFPNHVYKLQKVLYGLKQAPRAWYVSASSPARVLSWRVNLCCVSLIWMVMQGEHTRVYPGSGIRRPYV
jgi:hypothetical protein